MFNNSFRPKNILERSFEEAALCDYVPETRLSIPKKHSRPDVTSQANRPASFCGKVFLFFRIASSRELK